MSDQTQKMGGDFLDRVVSMAHGEYTVLAPRLASLYEPVDDALAKRGFTEPAMRADADPLPADDASGHTAEIGQKYPLSNSSRSGATAKVEPPEWANDLIAPVPRKPLDERGSERDVKVFPRIRIEAVPRPAARADVDPLEADPESPSPVRRTLLAADFSQPDPTFGRVPPQVSVPDRDETHPRRDATHTPRALEKSGQLIAQFLKIQAMPEPSECASRPAEPVIHVSIGRVEIRATQAPGPSRAPRSAPKLMGLDEYLSNRGDRE